MTTTEAIQTLTEYQQSGVLSINPLTIRAAIDKAIEVMQESLNDGILIDIEEGANNWIKAETATGADHWSFKQGAKWAIDKLINSCQQAH